MSRDMEGRFAPLTAELERRISGDGGALLAIEGMCTAGKTTLAAYLAEKYGCTVFHMDDFFLRPEQRCEARYAQVGGNVDHERFLSEVLEPLSRGGQFSYRPYDCHKAKLAEPVTVTPWRLCVVEGSYSMHPALAGYYDISAFLSVTPQLQKKRVLERPEFLHDSFFRLWIPMENSYFAGTGAKERCTMSFDCNI